MRIYKRANLFFCKIRRMFKFSDAENADLDQAHCTGL